MQALPQGSGTRAIYGARTLFMFNGNPVAFATGVSVGENISSEEIAVLGNLLVVEHPLTAYRASLSCSILRTIARGNVVTADAPGSLKQQQIFPRLNQILRLEGVDVVCVDVVTKKTIYMFRNVKCVSHNSNIGAMTTSLQNVGFVTTEMLDESQIANLKTARAAA